MSIRQMMLDAAWKTTKKKGLTLAHDRECDRPYSMTMGGKVLPCSCSRKTVAEILAQEGWTVNYHEDN